MVRSSLHWLVPSFFYALFVNGVYYGADMELWLKHSSALTYANDTSSSLTSKTIEEVQFKLEEDAEQVLNSWHLK